MKIQTFSILTGSEACNARCPFCVSKMTPPLGMTLKQPEVNWRNFHIAARLAEKAGATTAMFTGKGEPCLFPGMISDYLRELDKLGNPFPLLELQTNGIPIMEKPEEFWTMEKRGVPFLDEWHMRGLTTIALSVVHWEPEKNRQIYLPYKKEYIDLPRLIDVLHERKFTVRIVNVMIQGFVDDIAPMLKMVEFARANKVEQLTFMPVNYPDTEAKAHPEVYEWTKANFIPPDTVAYMKQYLDSEAEPLLQLAHGAMVYDLDGQNICLNNCLHVDPNAQEMRNLIFHPDGHLRYYWQYPGAVLL